jgi:hypothetical protein
LIGRGTAIPSQTLPNGPSTATVLAVADGRPIDVRTLSLKSEDPVPYPTDLAQASG